MTSFKRLTVALAIILPAAALTIAPVMAASHSHSHSHSNSKKPHHASVHKASTHKTAHSTRTTTPTAS